MDRKIHSERKNTNLWKTMSNLSKKQDDDGVTQSVTLNMSPHEINEYFASVSRKTPQHPIHGPDYLTPVSSTDLFVFSKLQPNHLRGAWKLMKKKASSTVDPLGMNNLMFDFCLKSDVFLSELCSVFIKIRAPSTLIIT
jgi:hypothetical protein